MAGKVKVRVLSNGSIALTTFFAMVCIILSAVGVQKFAVLRNAMQDYISCEKAANELQEGSDILTKQVRLAAATGQQEYIDAYFKEANEVRRREKALSELTALNAGSDVIADLQEAFSFSTGLMKTEYYAMRLTEEAIHADLGVWPAEIKECELTADDEKLSDSEKLNKAQNMLISLEYENVKDEISGDVDDALLLLTNEIAGRQQHAAEVFSIIFQIVIICISVFAVVMLIEGLIMRFWIVLPLINYTKSIQQGSLLQSCGVNELQLLGDTYNRVYEENEERERLMKHQAEHDSLTDVLNRGAFDRILSLYEKDENRFALILIDVDTFKNVNDTYGHAVGDIILKRVAEYLTNAFRSIDYVFRIGGDEFAVIMVNMTSDLAYTITEKVQDVNRQLAAPGNNIPVVSLSVGVAFTDRENPGASLFKDADKALYYTKEHGRCGCNIYPV